MNEHTELPKWTRVSQRINPPGFWPLPLFTFTYQRIHLLYLLLHLLLQRLASTSADKEAVFWLFPKFFNYWATRLRITREMCICRFGCTILNYSGYLTKGGFAVFRRPARAWLDKSLHYNREERIEGCEAFLGFLSFANSTSSFNINRWPFVLMWRWAFLHFCT